MALRPVSNSDTNINLANEVRAIKENEKIVITNALDEKFEVEPRDYPGLSIDALVTIDKMRYSVCYAVQRRTVKPNHLFFPFVYESIKEKVRTDEWFKRTGAQLIAYYNYTTQSVWLMKTQSLRELDVVINKELKEYIPHANSKVYGFLISYHDIDLTEPLLIEVTDEKHQLGLALAQSLYF